MDTHSFKLKIHFLALSNSWIYSSENLKLMFNENTLPRYGPFPFVLILTWSLSSISIPSISDSKHQTHVKLRLFNSLLLLDVKDSNAGIFSNSTVLSALNISTPSFTTFSKNDKNLKILSQANSLIANNNIRSVILEILKNSILTILHLPF